MIKIALADSNVDFWRENSNDFDLIRKVACNIVHFDILPIFKVEKRNLFEMEGARRMNAAEKSRNLRHILKRVVADNLF